MAIPILFLSFALMLGPASPACDVHHGDLGTIGGPHVQTYAHRCGGGHSVTVASLDGYDPGTKFGSSLGGALFDHRDLFNGTGERTQGGSITFRFVSLENEALPDIYGEIRYSRTTSQHGPTSAGHLYVQLDRMGSSKTVNIPPA